MKRVFILHFLIFLGLNSFGQSLKPITLIEQRSYYLNGGARAAYGGISRETIKIDLPQNTRSWYYSFTTSPGQDGTHLLNLGIQLGSALYGGALGSSIASSIKVPEGSGSADVYVIPVDSRDAFLRKDENNWKIYKDISVQNAKQAVQYIDSSYGSSFYLALRNPSALTGINISIEVVAIVEEENLDSDKGILYGNLGWKAFERGDYDKCIELSKQALQLDNSLGFVHFNIALSYLIKGQNSNAINQYTKAISVTKKSSIPKQTFQGAIDDLKTYMERFPSKQDAQDILELLIEEIKYY